MSVRIAISVLTLAVAQTQKVLVANPTLQDSACFVYA